MSVVKIKDAFGEVDIMKKEKMIEKTELSFKEKFNRDYIKPCGIDTSYLNQKERDYFDMMYPQEGVLFLTSAPGIAKSAMQRSLAKKIQKVELVFDSNGEIDLENSGKLIAQSLFYIDLRLSMIDETDVGLYPDKAEFDVIQGGISVKKMFLDHIVPNWARLSNNPPQKQDLPYIGTLIHFEELNRAQLSVRNASLQILLERCIGFEFEFNDNVFMVSTGNLGDEDGTDVEEFDAALNGRLIHIEHTLSMDEWFEYFANENIHPLILKFLTVHSEFYYQSKKARTEKDRAYASPRTWTFLSKYINKNFGKNANPNRWVRRVAQFGHGYVGAAVNTKFVKFVNDVLKININDIIEKYEQLQSEGVSFTRDKNSELLGDLKQIKLESLKDYQIENVKLFMLDLGEDELAAFMLRCLDTEYKIVHNDKQKDRENNNFIISYLKDRRFKKYQDVMMKHIDANSITKKSTGVVETV